MHTSEVGRSRWRGSAHTSEVGEGVRIQLLLISEIGRRGYVERECAYK